jgi:hypothetical protein
MRRVATGADARRTIASTSGAGDTGAATMILATTTFADYERFMEIFSTKGADKRGVHGSKGAQIFRDPNQDDRVWVLFDWDEAGWQSFVSDPEVPPIMKEAGHTSRAQVAALSGELDA